MVQFVNTCHLSTWKYSLKKINCSDIWHTGNLLSIFSLNTEETPASIKLNCYQFQSSNVQISMQCKKLISFQKALMSRPQINNGLFTSDTLCFSLKNTMLTTYALILIRFLKNNLIEPSNSIHAGLMLADAHLKFTPRDAV